jgi:MerR family transcriptional regulator/heat shock protein HspR
MNEENIEPRYVISIAARMVGIETYTLRYYERIGLVSPFRSQGKIRYYSESEIEQLRQIRRLVNDLGVNPAGVEVAMRMAKMISQLQNQVKELTAELKQVKQEKPSGSKPRKKITR